MSFTDIRLQNYRSYMDSSFELDNGVNIVVGPNAAGKTNLLEALMVGATGKSFRGKDALLLRHGSDWTRIDIHTSTNITRVVKLETNPVGKIEKSFEIDEKKYKKLTKEYFQPIVLFQPDNLRLLQADPSDRRDYMDDLLEQFVFGYTKLRSDTKRALSQRNALLKQPSPSESQLFAWNIRLCELASKVVEQRQKLIETINSKIEEIYHGISGKNINLKIQYSSKTNLENYSLNLMTQLNEQYSLDRLRGFTGRGPHRDDMVVYCGPTPMSEMGSRGENRTLVLALKIIELQILENHTGKRPLLLLDDVFSELDGMRRKSLVRYLADYQTIVTTTDVDVSAKYFSGKTNKIYVDR